MVSAKLRKTVSKKVTKRPLNKGLRRKSKNRRQSYFSKARSQQEDLERNQLISKLGACATCDCYEETKPHYSTIKGIEIFCSKIADRILAKTQLSSFEDCESRPVKMLVN